MAMTRRHFRIFVPLIVIVALLAWWWTPHYSDEDKAYYAAVFCTVNNGTADGELARMEQVIEGGNSDYALRKTHFSSSLANKVIASWTRLGAEEKQRLEQQPTRCAQRLFEEMNR